jgi:hypothetical protein
VSELERLELASLLADKIFEAGSEPEEFGGPTKRIQFMGRNPKTVSEWAMGGFNKDALAACIFNALTAREAAPPTTQSDGG